MSFLQPNNANGIRVAYTTWKPESFYHPEYSTYLMKIPWNQYQSSIAKLRKKPPIGKLETKFAEDQITFHTLNHGAGGFNEHHRFIVIQANDRARANRCAKEIGLPLLRFS